MAVTLKMLKNNFSNPLKILKFNSQENNIFRFTWWLMLEAEVISMIKSVLETKKGPQVVFCLGLYIGLPLVLRRLWNYRFNNLSFLKVI